MEESLRVLENTLNEIDSRKAALIKCLYGVDVTRTQQTSPLVQQSSEWPLAMQLDMMLRSSAARMRNAVAEYRRALRKTIE